MRSNRPDSDRPEGVSPADALTDELLWGRLLRWQARREHAQAELMQKLRQLGADEAQCHRLLERLSEAGYQSEGRFTEALVRSQLQRGKAPRAIRQRLQQAGVAADPETLQAQWADIDWTQRALALLQRRFGVAPPTTDRDTARALRFLQQRGYDAGMAWGALRAWQQAMTPEDSPP